MNKQELIQTHALLDRLKTEFSDETPDTVTVESHPNYEEVGVSKIDIHRSKTDHKNAVLALATDIANGLEQSEPTESTVASEVESEVEATIMK